MEIKFIDGIYKGECENGIPHGNGFYTAQNGNVYNGMWENGEFIRGVLHCGEKVYIGEFKNMLPHGNGTEYTSRFRQFTGIFEAGKKAAYANGNAPYDIIESGIKTPMSFSTYKPEKIKMYLGIYFGGYGEYISCFPLEKLSQTVGFDVLCLNDMYKYAYGYSGNGIATQLYEENVNGNIIICRSDKEGMPLPFKSPEEADFVYDTIWDELFDPHHSPLCHYVYAVKIEKISDTSAVYLIKDKLYLAEHTYYGNSRYDDEGWSCAHPQASARVHLLPNGMADAKDALAYAAEQNAWSQWAEEDKECNERDTFSRSERELLEKCLYKLTAHEM